jgi:hypothetical protein
MEINGIRLQFSGAGQGKFTVQCFVIRRRIWTTSHLLSFKLSVYVLNLNVCAAHGYIVRRKKMFVLCACL